MGRKGGVIRKDGGAIRTTLCLCHSHGQMARRQFAASTGSGSMTSGLTKRTLNCLLQWPDLDVATCASLLKRCGDAKSLPDGRHIHAHLARCGLDRNTLLSNLLLNMYGKCGRALDARRLFDAAPRRNSYSWSMMIAAYAQNAGHEREALRLFDRMRSQGGLAPDKYSFIPALSASTALGDLAEGKRVHSCMVSTGVEPDIVMETSLVNLYGKCKRLSSARGVFEGMKKRDAISWNAIMAAYAQNGHSEEALEVSSTMGSEGVEYDRCSFLIMLDVCTDLGSLDRGRAVHKHISKSQFATEISVQTALLNMYGKCGSPDDARAVFDGMSQRNVVSWTAMIASYVRNGRAEEAITLFECMDVDPDLVTFSTVLDACASVPSLEAGRVIHRCFAVSKLGRDVIVETAIVNMYGKCGSLVEARAVFDEMRQRDTIAWNAIIAAYAQNGNGEEALELFARMVSEKVKPDNVTFGSVLSACGHAGLLDEGQRHFSSISRAYGMTPSIEHYRCMIDLFGRRGRLGDAEDLLNNSRMQNDPLVWTALLTACRTYGDAERGARAAKRVVELDPKHPSPYIMLSNIYAAAGRWDDVAWVRKEMEERWGKGAR